MGLKQKVVFGSGVTSPTDIYEINDQGGKLTSAPKGPYSISESINLVFTNSIVGNNSKNINIADGERRPGTK
jgi:hypothetical protein